MVNKPAFSTSKGLLKLNTHQRIPSWNISGRPKKPKKGTVGFNIETNCLEFWNGSSWLQLPMEKIS